VSGWIFRDHSIPLCHQDGRIHIEKINAPFLYTLKASGPEFGAGIKAAVERGWLELHESGTYVRLLKGGDAQLSR